MTVKTREKAQCPECGRYISLNPARRIRTHKPKHKTTPTVGQHEWCKGSDFHVPLIEELTQ